MTTRKAISTTSSPGRRPFGKPAKSLPATPKVDCIFAGVASILVFNRSNSDGVTLASWLTPAKPVRKAVTKSVRGKLVGAKVGKFAFKVVFTASLNRMFRSSGKDG